MAQRPWLVSIFPFDAPPSIYALAKQHPWFADALALWTEYLGEPVIRADADTEDFVEQAARLHAACVALPEEGAILRVAALHGSTFSYLSLADGSPVEPPEDYIAFGSQPSERSSHSSGANVVDSYGKSSTFQKYAGRRVAMSGYFEGPEGLYPQAMEFAQAGLDELYVKIVYYVKYGQYRIPLRPDITLEEVQTEVFRADEAMSCLQLEELHDTLLLQEVIPMHYEYRFTVVDHQLVAGAGCVEAHTPLQNSSRFDSKVARRRNMDPVESRPWLVESYLDFARDVVWEWSAEHPEAGSYVLDVATGHGGQTVIVEFNNLLNAGLYASNPVWMAQAMRRSVRDGHAPDWRS